MSKRDKPFDRRFLGGDRCKNCGNVVPKRGTAARLGYCCKCVRKLFPGLIKRQKQCLKGKMRKKGKKKVRRDRVAQGRLF